MKDLGITLLIWSVFLSLPVGGALVVYAKVSVCGWKGLFVECRIMDCPAARGESK